jgi:3-deoxy-7-phosphoheptulonate synthase
MLLALKENLSLEKVTEFVKRLEWMGLRAVPNEENGRYTVAIVAGIDQYTDLKQFSIFPEVDQVLPFSQKFKLVGRDFKKNRTVIAIKDVEIGGGTLVVMAGPCSIESEEQIHTTAKLVAASGAKILRGGAFKPRTSPYEFQGLGEAGLRFMQEAARANNMLCISELMDSQDIDLLVKYVDIVQIGARNMQNFSLLKQLGKIGKPVMLKRGLAATYMEFLFAAEYIVQAGNPNVMLCERGIRTFETYTRNTLDLAAVPVLHDLSHLPVIIDPSHGTGVRSLVPPMTCAAVAVGADGVIVEVHPQPEKSLSDANQTISPATFAQMMESVRAIGKAVNIKVI